MPAENRTKNQLLAELELAYQRISELENIAEKALQKYDDYFRIHFSLSNDVMYSFDHNYTLQYVTPNVERILGYKPEELVGRKIFHLLNILDPLDHEDVIADAIHALSGNTILYSVYRFIAKDGSMKFGEVSGVPLAHEGKVVAVVSVAREVTERISKENPKDKIDTYRATGLDDRLNPQVLLDTSGVVLDLNDEAARILEKDRNELVGSSIFHHLPEDLARRRRVNFDRIMSSGKSDSFLEEHKGSIFFNTMSPICDEKGRVVKIEFKIQELSGKRFTTA